jgi:AcrR family transcriptional regulator
MMPRRKTAGERRLEVIAATLRLAAEIGPERITADAIARDLGVSQPAIFRHFPRKDDIWEATIAWLAAHLAERWAAALAGAHDPDRRLEALLSAQFRAVEAIPALPTILLSPELQARHDGIRRALLTLMSRFHGVLAEVIDGGKAAGLWSPELDAARAGWMLIALVQGTAIRWASSRRGFDLVAEGMAVASIAMAGMRHHPSR